jgi:16S rRNA (adenine1518-N6/adenine1519-N6)-dimethyltransferase
MNGGHKKFEDPRGVLKRHGLKPKRSWGQNFLVSEKAINTIAKTCVDSSGRRIIEIGAGLGTLTGVLLGMGGRVTAVERDREMCEVLRADFTGRDGFALAEADAVDFDYLACLDEQPGVIVGNLPYQLTGRLLRKVIEIGPPMIRAVLMVQEEVANRVVAAAGDKGRGGLSVVVQARCRSRVIHRLKPTAFFPPPKVRSAIIELVPLEENSLNNRCTWQSFDRVVKAAFSSRRKMLRNTLVSGGLVSLDEVEELLRVAGIDSRLRSERLTVEQFVQLAAEFQKEFL